jgi:hypothetical protein
MPVSVRKTRLGEQQTASAWRPCCGRSRPTPWRFASLVCTDAFAGALTRGSTGTIPETAAETENTRSYQGGLWLGNLDSNQD